MAHRHDSTEAPTTDDEDRCTDTHGASKILDLSAVTLHQWRLLGKGPAFYRFGRQIRYSIKELRAYMAARRVGGGQ